MTQVVKIAGMKCAGCVDKVQARFAKIAGVQTVTVDLKDQAATITAPEPIAKDALMQALVGTHYQVTD